ncbi:MAG: cation:proton antiporter [Elusimicrobia bacterium]|jgi:Kef-type K+ transport system membrane component KefB|nr:cation:proton antiporter [Elusimicrobiota bacterium]
MIPNVILSLGFILLAGLVAATIIKSFKFPTITAYLVLGIIIGPHFLGFISNRVIASSGLISNIVLSFIAFSIGQNFSRDRFRQIGKVAISISISEAVFAAAAVGIGLALLTDLPLFVVLSFAAIAPATAPAAIVMVVRQFGAKGKFTDTLLAVVALDDSWGLMIFALILAVAKSMTGSHTNIFSLAISGVFHGMIEIFGAIALGCILGTVLSKLAKYVKNQSDTLTYTLGFILLNAGLSLFLDVSVLLSNMAMAAVIVNINKTGFKFFEALRNIDAPFYLLFFVLAGANLELGMVSSMGIIGIVYLVARVAGKIIGVYVGGTISAAGEDIKKYLGIGLAPQAGVALGMAMIIKNVFPKEGGFIMSTIIATTVVYEIIGPVFTKMSLRKAGNLK